MCRVVLLCEMMERVVYQSRDVMHAIDRGWRIGMEREMFGPVTTMDLDVVQVCSSSWSRALEGLGLSRDASCRCAVADAAWIVMSGRDGCPSIRALRRRTGANALR